MSHLSLEERLKIELGLKQNKSLNEIAKELKRPLCTISREIYRNRTKSYKIPRDRIINRCIHRFGCELEHLCSDKSCHRKCRSCNLCNEVCHNFKGELCKKLEEKPFVCTNCPEEHKCVLIKYYYQHDEADKKQQDILKTSREGVNLTEDERKDLEKILAPGVRNNQSIHHIVVTNKNQISVSEKSMYRYINGGLFASVIRLDLPRAVSMKPRKKKYPEHNVDTKCRQNRTYADYQNYLLHHPETAVVEMDSVLGKRTGKVLLTMQFVNCSFMLVFIRENNTAQSVIDVFNNLEKKLGLQIFRRLFPVILTDNGPEFSNPGALENSPFSNEPRTKIFYCDPYSSFQKGHIENNHLNLRKIFPKGESMDSFSQSDVDLAVSHLNSFARERLNNIPAFTLFQTMYGTEITNMLNIRLIEHDKICLLPDLIKK